MKPARLIALGLASGLYCATCGASEPPTLKLDGAVLHPQVFARADLKAMPPVQVDVSVHSMHGDDHHQWTGVLLLSLIQKAGLKNDSGKNSFLHHTLLIHGQDGYVAALAIGEIDPMGEDKQVIVAYRRSGDDADLPGLRLVVPGDKHAPRQVHDVVEIEVR
jgi:DMSO/TMAO reductase YedYZ molybdopterin-dependent catalytic subunit